MSFASYLAPNANNVPPFMAIGGDVILRTVLGPQLRQASLSYQDASPTTYPVLPATFRATFGVQMPNTNTFPAWNTSDLYGHRLSLVFSTDGTTASLNLDAVNANLGNVQGSETRLTTSSGLSSSEQVGVALFISHPYGVTPANTSASTTMNGSAAVYLQTGTTVAGAYVPGIYDIVIGLGPTGQGMVEKHRNDLQAAEANVTNSSTSEPVLGESLAVMGTSWLAERSQAEAVLAGASNTAILVQQELGVVGMKGLVSPSNANTLIYGPYFDIPTNTVSIVQLASRGQAGGPPTQRETGAFFADQLLGSSLEANVIKQTQPGVSAFSTTSLITSNVAYTGAPRTWDLFDIDNLSLINGSGAQTDNCAFYAGQVGSSGGTRRQLLAAGYLLADVQAIDALVGYNSNSGACQASNPSTGQPVDRVIATGYGTFFGNSQLGGAGYLDINQAGTTIRSLITGNLSGGLSGTTDSTGQVATNTPSSTTTDSMPPTAAQIGTVQGGGAAVQAGIGTADLLSGAFTYSHTDLSIGSGGFPYALSYTRSYDSGNRLQTSPYGNGWSGSIQSTATVVSDPYEGLGTVSAVEAAPSIASLYAAASLLTPTGTSTTPSLQQIAQGATAVDWFVSNFTVGNAIAVAQPGNTEHFVTLGNGTYVAPPGSADTINSNNGLVTLTAKTGEVSSFDTIGNLTKWTSPAGPQVSITYQNPGSGEQPVTIANNMGRSLSLSWSGTNLQTVTDETGRKVGYAYDIVNNLTTITDPTGAVTTFTYDLFHHLTGITTPTSDTSSKTATTAIAYDSLDRLETLTDADSHAASYYFAGSRAEIDDAYQDANVTYFDPLGNAIDSLDPDGDKTSTTYDALNRKLIVITPDNQFYGFIYDGFNDLVQLNENPASPAQDPHPDGGALAGRSKKWTYDPKLHHVTSALIGWNDQPVTYAINATTGLTTSTTDPAPSSGAAAPVTSYTYDSKGQVTSQTLPDGTLDTYTYTADEDLASSTVDSGTNELNLTTTYGYDGVGNVASMTTPSGHTTKATYDALRRPLVVTPPTDQFGNTNTKTTAYDLNGQVSSVTITGTASGSTAAPTSTTSNLYDLAGNLIATTDASGKLTEYTYDLANRHVATFQDDNKYRNYTNYDAASRVVSHDVQVPSANFIVDSTTYTPGGLKASYCYYQTAGTCLRTTYTYDGYDRPWYTTYPDGSQDHVASDPDDVVDYAQARGGIPITLTLDNLRRVITRTGATTVDYSYDTLNRPTITQEQGPVAGGEWREVYDRAGRVTAQTQPWITGAQTVNGAPWGNTTFLAGAADLTYGYDGDGDVTSFKVDSLASGSFAETITYDNLDRPIVYNFGNNGNWSNLYDFTGRREIRGYTVDSAGTQFNSFWTYDANHGGLDLTQVFHRFGPDSSNISLNYSYNNAHQVSGFTEQSTGTTLPNGDITPRPPLAANSGTLTYNTLNQAVLANCARNTATCYNASGDLINDATRTFTYDTEGSGRITSATNGSTSALYAYDPWGRRIGKVVNGVTTATILSPAGHEIAELVNGQLAESLYYDPSDTAPVATADASGTVTYNYTDNLGSVVARTQGGQISTSTGYLPYGDTTTGTLTGTEFGYAGYRFDAETGLYHTATRSYDPKTGRFIQPDPISYAGGRDLYAYAGGDPINGTDPGGTDQSCEGGDASCEIETAIGAGIYNGFGGDGGSGGGGGSTGGSSDLAQLQALAGSLNETLYPISSTQDSTYYQLGSTSIEVPNDVTISPDGTINVPPVQVGGSSQSSDFNNDPNSVGNALQNNVINDFHQMVRNAISLIPLVLIPEAEPVAIAAEGVTGLGDLTAGEVGQIQNVVDAAGRPLDVVGSTALAARTATSDIDYTTANANFGNFEGLEGQLPGIDPEHGLLRGHADPNVGPSIRFEPGTTPYFVPGVP